MPKQKNWGRVWEQIVDYLVPLLQLLPPEQAVYYFLLRQSRLKGRQRVTITRRSLALGVRYSTSGLTPPLLSLIRKRCLVPHGHDYRGTTWEVFLPEEIVVGLGRGAYRKLDLNHGTPAYRVAERRLAVLRRDHWRCFYCRKRVTRSNVSLDHLTPLSKGGSPRIENTVACCQPCNREKYTGPASCYLAKLYRMKRLTRAQFKERMDTLRSLQLALAEAMDV